MLSVYLHAPAKHPKQDVFVPELASKNKLILLDTVETLLDLIRLD